MKSTIRAILTLTICLFSLVANAASNTEMWHLTFRSNSGITPSGKLIKLNDNGKYFGYAIWQSAYVEGEGIVTWQNNGSFSGKTYKQSNQDICELRGTVRNLIVAGEYSCKSGDKGTLDGNITLGFSQN